MEKMKTLMTKFDNGRILIMQRQRILGPFVRIIAFVSLVGQRHQFLSVTMKAFRF